MAILSGHSTLVLGAGVTLAHRAVETCATTDQIAVQAESAGPSATTSSTSIDRSVLAKTYRAGSVEVGRTAAPLALARFAMPFQVVAQRRSVVVLAVPGGIDQGEGALLALLL